MNIIIEGPDGAGKSTLANELAKLLNMSVRHFGAPRNSVEAAQQYSLYLDITDGLYNTIIDRAWYSDMVYGPIFRNGAHINYQMMIHLERNLDDAVLIYCTGAEHEMWLAAQKRGETYVENYTQFKEICRQYDYIMKQVPHNIPVHIREAKWL